MRPLRESSVIAVSLIISRLCGRLVEGLRWRKMRGSKNCLHRWTGKTGSSSVPLRVTNYDLHCSLGGGSAQVMSQ